VKQTGGSVSGDTLQYRFEENVSSKSVHFRRSYSRTREDRFLPTEYFYDRLVVRELMQAPSGVCECIVPPSIDSSLVSPFNLSVIVERSISIDCPVTGVPQPDISWVKDGQRLSTNQNDDIRVVSRGQRLEVNNADLSDAGRYTCFAKNPAGFVERNFQLHVWGEFHSYHNHMMAQKWETSLATVVQIRFTYFSR